MSASPGPSEDGVWARALAFACRAFALAGGLIFAALALLVMASVAGRALGRPIQGDFELVQLGCAAGIALLLPYCQMRRANIIVDFFTVRASPRMHALLDVFGAALYMMVLGVLAWRVGVGTLAIRATNETTMIMGVPIWHAYVVMTPGFALAALAGAYTLAQSWRMAK
jgi:TRAP-type C4-dicarboxylate transport system permease small subunit